MESHPSAMSSEPMPAPARSRIATRVEIPRDRATAEVEVAAGQTVTLTNLQKLFWPEDGITKRDLLQYYADLSPVLLPHLLDRAMVMKRYPDGAYGKFFFHETRARTAARLDRRSATSGTPPLTSSIFPSSRIWRLLWVVNLGCIDLNPWYARCDDVDRPDYLHFDLDPDAGCGVRAGSRAALRVARSLARTEDRQLSQDHRLARHSHLRAHRARPAQKQVWTFAKCFASELASTHPELSPRNIASPNGPPNRVLVDYNQNAWGRTLASVYSVRPKPRAPVSAPVTWEEIEQGIATEDFRLDNMPERVKTVGDLYEPLLLQRSRVEAGTVLMNLPITLPFLPMEANIAAEIPIGP